MTYTSQPEPTGLINSCNDRRAGCHRLHENIRGLLEYTGKELTPQPGLASSWTVSPDQTTYTFTLRPNVTWQDGKPFTSADVKFSIEKIILPLHAPG